MQRVGKALLLPQSLRIVSVQKFQGRGVFIGATAKAKQVAAGGWAALCLRPSTFPPWERGEKKASNKILTLQTKAMSVQH